MEEDDIIEINQEDEGEDIFDDDDLDSGLEEEFLE